MEEINHLSGLNSNIVEAIQYVMKEDYEAYVQVITSVQDIVNKVLIKYCPEAIKQEYKQLKQSSASRKLSTTHKKQKQCQPLPADVKQDVEEVQFVDQYAGNETSNNQQGAALQGAQYETDQQNTDTQTGAQRERANIQTENILINQNQDSINSFLSSLEGSAAPNYPQPRQEINAAELQKIVSSTIAPIQPKLDQIVCQQQLLFEKQQTIIKNLMSNQERTRQENQQILLSNIAPEELPVEFEANQLDVREEDNEQQPGYDYAKLASSFNHGAGKDCSKQYYNIYRLPSPQKQIEYVLSGRYSKQLSARSCAGAGQ